jgi:hypothetical protein
MNVEKIKKVSELIDELDGKLREQILLMTKLRRSFANKCREWLDADPDHEMAPEVAGYVADELERLAREKYGVTDLSRSRNTWGPEVRLLRDDWRRYRGMAA